MQNAQGPQLAETAARNMPVEAGSGAAHGRLTYSVADAASVLGVSRATIYRLLYRGLLSAVPGLRHKLIARSSVVHFVEQGGRRDA